MNAATFFVASILELVVPPTQAKTPWDVIGRPDVMFRKINNKDLDLHKAVDIAPKLKAPTATHAMREIKEVGKASVKAPIIPLHVKAPKLEAELSPESFFPMSHSTKRGELINGEREYRRGDIEKESISKVYKNLRDKIGVISNCSQTVVVWCELAKLSGQMYKLGLKDAPELPSYNDLVTEALEKNLIPEGYEIERDFVETSPANVYQRLPDHITCWAAITNGVTRICGYGLWNSYLDELEKVDPEAAKLDREILVSFLPHRCLICTQLTMHQTKIHAAMIFASVMETIFSALPTFGLFSKFENEMDILVNTCSTIGSILSNAGLSMWAERDNEEYTPESDWAQITAALAGLASGILGMVATDIQEPETKLGCMAAAWACCVANTTVNTAATLIVCIRQVVTLSRS